MTSSSEHPLAAWGPAGRRLLRTLACDRVSPSYLFEGADSEVLLEAAQAFAVGLLGGAPPAALDPSLVHRVKSGNHPDFHHITKDKATVISVAALTGALERAHSTPLEAEHQVFLIQPAEAMEAEGIARYLKALEEPPGGTVFLLLSSRADRLPETVLSRCRRVRFAPLDATLLAARLREAGVEDRDAAWGARHAGGSLTQARRLLDTRLADVVTPLLDAAEAETPFVAKTVESALAHLTKQAGELAAADTAQADTKRQQLRVLLSDVVRILCVEARERVAARASALPAAVGAAQALDLLERWGRLSAAIAANVTPAVVLLEAVATVRSCAQSQPTHA